MVRQRADAPGAQGFQFIASDGRTGRDCLFAPFHGAARDGAKPCTARFIDRNQRATAAAQLRGAAALRSAGIVRNHRRLKQRHTLCSPAERPVMNPLRLHLGRVHLAAGDRDRKQADRIGHELGRMQRSRARLVPTMRASTGAPVSPVCKYSPMWSLAKTWTFRGSASAAGSASGRSDSLAAQ